MSDIVRKPVTGSVQQKNGAWHAVLYYTDFETGKRKPKWQKIGKISLKRGDGGLTEKQAENLLPRFIVEEENRQDQLFQEAGALEGKTVHEREIIKRQNTDFYDYVHQFVERSVNRGLALKTYISYTTMCRARIKDFFHGKYLVKDIDYFVLETFFDKFNEDGLARTTKTRYKALIKQVLDEAVNNEIIPSNPIYRFQKGTFGKSDFKSKPYTDDEISELLEKLITSDDILAKLSAITFYYALRREEGLGGKWAQIDFDKKTVSLETAILDVSAKLSPEIIKKKFKSVTKVITTKGRSHIVEQNTLKTDGSSVVMPLLDSVYDLLKAIKNETEQYKELFGNCYDKRFEEYVFVRPDGYIITPTYVSSHFSHLLKKFDMRKVRFHDIRHTTATLLLKQGWSIKHIQEWLRHSDPTTTAKFYVDVDEEERARVGFSLDEKYKLPKKEVAV